MIRPHWYHAMQFASPVYGAVSIDGLGGKLCAFFCGACFLFWISDWAFNS